jgi:hypothetical protein
MVLLDDVVEIFDLADFNASLVLGWKATEGLPTALPAGRPAQAAAVHAGS